MPGYRRARFPALVSPWFVFPKELIALVSPASGAGGVWPSANLAIYIPFTVPIDALINGVSVYNTAGNSAGRNWDVGIFDTNQLKLSSQGATLVAAGVNTWAASQHVVGGEQYYVGVSANNTSLGFWRLNYSVINLRLVGIAQEASAEPLPSTATPAQIASAYLPFVTFTFANLPTVV